MSIPKSIDYNTDEKSFRLPKQTRLRGMPWVLPPRAQPMKGPEFLFAYIYEACSSPQYIYIYMRHAVIYSATVFYVHCFGSLKAFCGPSYAAAAQINMTCARASHPNSQRAGMQWRRTGWEMRWEGRKFQHLFCKEPKLTWHLTFAALIPFPKIRLISSSNSNCPQLV
jgi:hypothetical protein